jgi:hypothetical protein
MGGPLLLISTSGSSRVTGSPARLNQRPIDNLFPAFGIVGTRISVFIGVILFKLARARRILCNWVRVNTSMREGQCLFHGQRDPRKR